MDDFLRVSTFDLHFLKISRKETENVLTDNEKVDVVKFLTHILELHMHTKLF